MLGKRPEFADRRWHLDRSNMVYAHRFFAVGQKYDFTFQRDDLFFTQVQREAIRSGDIYLFISGTLHYRDLQGERRYQNFTARFEASDGSMVHWEV